MCNEPWITIVGNLSVKVTDPMPQNVSDESTDYRLTDAKVEPFYNEAEKMRNNK